MSDEKPHQFRPPLYHQDSGGTDTACEQRFVRAARMGRLPQMAISRQHQTKLD